MITNNELAKALNDDRDRWLADRHRSAAAYTETTEMRRTVGRWLEHLGRRLQGPPRPSRSSA